MGNKDKIKELYDKAKAEAKTVPKGLWIASCIVPGGWATLALYFAGKGVYNLVKGKKDDRSENSSG